MTFRRHLFMMGLRFGLIALILADHVLTLGMFDETGLKNFTSDEFWRNTSQDNGSFFTNSSDSEDHNHAIIGDSGYWFAVSVIVLTLAAFIIVSNAAMIVCYVASSKVRHILRIFVFNLCLVDFQNGCIALPLSVIYPRGAARDWMGDVSGPACIFISFWPTSLAITAFLSIVLVTIDRFIAIVFPLHFHKIAATKHCIIVVILIWIYAILFSFAPAYAIKTSSEANEKYIVGCNGLYVYSAFYMDYLLFVILCVPLVGVLVMYLVMYCIAHKHLKAIAAVTVTNRVISQSDKRVMSNSKAAKTTCIMTFIFVVCWVPFLIIMVLSDLCNFDTCPEFTSAESLHCARIVTSCLAFLNSAVNPWIYGFRNTVIQREMRSIFCKKKQTSVLPMIAESTTGNGQDYYYSSSRNRSVKRVN